VLEADVRGLLAAPIGLQLLEFIVMEEREQLTELDLIDLLVKARSVASRYRGDFDEYVRGLRSRAASLETVAVWLRRNMAHWWGDLARDSQLWISTETGSPDPRHLSIDLSAYSSDGSKPKRAFWTSTMNPARSSPWLNWLQEGEDRRPGPYYVWRLKVLSAARVFEIRSASDWAELARRYPSGATPIDPRWSAVANDWDGVHLSIGGLLTAQDVVYQSDGGVTQLRGWDVESTAWLRWSFAAVQVFDGQ
jgi:hypothetical protein